MTQVGRTPYFNSHISETKFAQLFTIVAGCRAVSITPTYEEVSSCLPGELCGCEETLRAYELESQSQYYSMGKECKRKEDENASQSLKHSILNIWDSPRHLSLRAARRGKSTARIQVLTMCCSAINRVPIRARRCSSRKCVTSFGLMYFRHSRKPLARVGIVCEWVSTRSASTDVKRTSSSRVVIVRDLYGRSVDRECR